MRLILYRVRSCLTTRIRYPFVSLLLSTQAENIKSFRILVT